MSLRSEAEVLGQAYRAGQWGAEQDRAGEQALAAARAVADRLRQYRGEGPRQTAELARAVHLVARLHALRREPDDAGRVLAEAISAAEPLAGYGPEYRGLIEQLRAEREVLAGLPASTPSGSTPGSTSGSAAGSAAGSTSGTTSGSTSGSTSGPVATASAGAGRGSGLSRSGPAPEQYSGTIDRSRALLADGRYREAAEVLAETDGVITMLWEQGARDRRSLTLNRYAALARSLLCRALRGEGRPERALAVGRQAVASGRIMLDVLPLDDPTRAEATAEVATSAVDVAELAFAGGLSAEAWELLEDAAAWCVGVRHPAVREAFGAVLYCRGTAVFDAVVHGMRVGQVTSQQLVELVRTAGHLVEVRRDLRDPQDPATCADLGRALLLFSQAEALGGDLERSAGHLAEATVELRGVVPAPADVGERLAAHAGLLQRQVPQVCDRYRALAQWPA
jgi:hypothetical protein